MDEHIVEPSGTIVKTIDWLTSKGFPRAWYLHGRNGSAVIFQESYHDTPRVAMQGDKLLFRQEDKGDERGYIVITQPEPDDPAWTRCPRCNSPDPKLHPAVQAEGEMQPCSATWHNQSGGRVSPSNMIDNGGLSDVSPAPIDHASDDPGDAQDGVAPHDPTLDIAVPAWFSGRVYVAGPMTGLPRYNYPAFMDAAQQLRDCGYEVENPARNKAPQNPTWANYMRVTIPQMLKCTGVALLDGWENSRGAKLEVQIALALGDFIVEPLERWLK